MARIKINLQMQVFEKEKISQIRRLFTEKEVYWLFGNKEVRLTPKLEVKKTLNNFVILELCGLDKKELEMEGVSAPKNRDKKCFKNNFEDYRYRLNLSFEGIIPAIIDPRENKIIFYDQQEGEDGGYLLHRVSKSLLAIHALDDYYDDEIKKLLLCIILAGVTVGIRHFYCKKMTVWFDEVEYRTENLMQIQDLSFTLQRMESLMVNTMHFAKTFAWMRNVIVCKNQVPAYTAVSALSYILNREAHECVLYAILGLESLFAYNKKDASKLLQKRINYVFPTITASQIEKIYRLRSDFVHGNIGVDMYGDLTRFEYGDLEYDEAADLAIGILLEVIRRLIANNASALSFDVMNSYRYIK